MKRIFPLLFVISYSLFTSPSHAQWEQIANNTSTRLFPNATLSNIIYAGIGVNIYGYNIFSSSDNGTTWFNENNMAVDMVQSNSVLYAGNIDYDGGAGVYRSRDSGLTWLEPDPNFWDVTYRNYADQILVAPLGATESKVITEVVSKVGNIYSTVDSGNTWLNAGGIPNRKIFAFAFLNGDMFAATSKGVYRTTNNGYVWLPVDTGLPNMQISCLLTDGNDLLVGGGAATIYNNTYPPSQKGLYRSNDGGEHWNVITTGLMNSYVSTLAIKGKNIFAGTDSDGIFLSTDDGLDWQNINNGLAYSFINSIAINKSYVFISDSAGIYRRSLSDFGINAVNGKPNDLPAQVSLEQNFPNPFSGVTNVEFRIPNEEYVTLDVYDMLGREVATLAQGEMSAGAHSVQLSANGLQNGIYFYRLTAGKNVQTGKMTVIR